MLKSVIVYSASFAFSIFCGRLYQKKTGNGSETQMPRIKKYMWLLLIIAAPVLISAVRVNVGTDYYNYYVRFLWNQSAGLFGALANTEPLYSLLDFIGGRVFGAFWGSLLLSAFVIHWFIILTLDYHKKDISIPLSLFFYYTLIFSVTLNGIRQSIAFSIVFYAYRYIREKKFLKYFLFVLLATLFHNTSVICLLFYVFAVSETEKYERAKSTVFYSILLLSPILVSLLVRAASNISFFSSYYTEYGMDFSSFRLGVLLDIVPLILPVLFYRRFIRDSGYDSLFNISLLIIPLKFAGYINIFINRLALFVATLFPLLISMVIVKNRNIKDRLTVTLIMILYFLFYYVYYTVLGGQGNAYPYSSLIF
ncbi:MAG: EpsG family protein [Oscillospiraceae bacterium]|jgi:transmembrane protein EpsG